MTHGSFHGSYHPRDVTFLLKPLEHMTQVDVAVKERLIQSGEKHYSEMISPEQHPSAAYMQLFEQAWARNGERTAQDLLKLASLLHHSRPGEITLVSLARAGTPFGIILKRLLELAFRRKVKHYSVSIIRDRGIDTRALDHIVAKHPQTSIAFIDGWTGKGVITQELQQSIQRYNTTHATHIDPSLWVLADLAGVAAHTASTHDYLIPSSILNATISGLISRSILAAEHNPDDFHGCLYYAHLEAQDVSRRYVDDLSQRALNLHLQTLHSVQPDSLDDSIEQRRQQVKELIAGLMREHKVPHINLIKPGIGEATRVLLRRTPGLLILSDGADHDIEHLRTLAKEKNVPTVNAPQLAPYQAIAIIKDIHHASA
ncbi:MAG TPA: hypothetical protein ENO09_09170 [bacterium]|nr:hypothetical protein [bacterium]